MTQPATRNSQRPADLAGQLETATLALLVWLLDLDGDQPDCYDLCWRDYTGQRRDEVLTNCRTGPRCCPFGRVLTLYPPETIASAAHTRLGP